MATSFTCASLKTKISDAFSPSFIDVINESHLHAGHAGRIGKDDDDITHIKIIMRAAFFDGMTRVKIHRAVYALLDAELENGLHAVALDISGDSAID